MKRLIAWVGALALGGSLLAGTVSAQQSSGPSLPREELTQQQQQRTVQQPYNNAPMWKAVRESGTQPGFTTLPGPEKGVLIQSFTQYPGSRLTNAGEAWRQVRNGLIIPYGGALLLIVLGGTLGAVLLQSPLHIFRRGMAMAAIRRSSSRQTSPSARPLAMRSMWPSLVCACAPVAVVSSTRKPASAISATVITVADAD